LSLSAGSATIAPGALVRPTLKAFYYEARMAQRPNATDADLHTWFWGETAVGRLIPAVAKRMNAVEDPAAKAVAYGIAR
jgi:hypothetical protein